MKRIRVQENLSGGRKISHDGLRIGHLVIWQNSINKTCHLGSNCWLSKYINKTTDK
jgi:hypothetical protein